MATTMATNAPAETFQLSAKTVTVPALGTAAVTVFDDQTSISVTDGLRRRPAI